MTNEQEIWIIGTEPPCPRCDYLSRMVKDVVDHLRLQVPVRHMSYTGKEARQFAAACGLEPGTAKDVARKAAVDIDWEKVHAQINGDGPRDAAQQEDSCCPTAANRWSSDLDELLRPCEIKALEAGIMMTPVLVVGGQCVHQGSVPDRNQVTQWIKAVFGGETEGDRCEHVVEVLGPGCEKCDQLYRNVLEALAQADLQDRVVVKKRTDIGYFLEKGVAVTPGLVINGTVVSKGKVLRTDQIADKLQSMGYELGVLKVSDMKPL